MATCLSLFGLNVIGGGSVRPNASNCIFRCLVISNIRSNIYDANVTLYTQTSIYTKIQIK